MTTLKSIVTIGVLLLVMVLHSQDMKQGFSYLESGQYAKAETFFADILKDYPENKTARLCYGRALGLNGEAKLANQLFVELLGDYPNDFEVKLNYGESLLWNNRFEDAERYYANLVQEDANSFPALLGYANTLSNLKDYEPAITYVDKALEVSSGNPNALVSKKYIYLGYAYQNQQIQNYAKAEELLLTNLANFENDKDTLLNLANLYLIMERFDDAENTYNHLREQPEHELLALNGLALVSHLKGKETMALDLSTAAYNKLGDNTDSIVKQQTTERYVQALIWNRKYTAAEAQIETLNSRYPNENWILALRATLNIYKSDFKASLVDYNQILANDSTSFDGNLGKANTLKALGRKEEAYAAAEKTLTFYNNQKDAVNFLETLDRASAPTLDTKASHTFDNGNNLAYTFSTAVSVPLSQKLTVLGNYNYRTAENSVTKNTASSNTFNLGASYELGPNITLKGLAGVSNATGETNDFSQFLTDIALSIKAFKLQTLDIGYQVQVESFNADLIDQQLVLNNYYVNYNLSTNSNLGWYTQYMFTALNDGNQRNLLFTSLYYNVLQKPGLKVGLNYQYITFKDQVPTVYFSPSRFNAGEVFVNLVRDEMVVKPKQWYYNVTAAFGYQFIEDDERQGAYRFQGAFGYKFSERALLNLYGTHSNIASATAAGFEFTEIGLRFKWLLRDTPLFRKSKK